MVDSISNVTNANQVPAANIGDDDSMLMKLISKIDSDGDGKISKDEFTAFATDVTEKTGQDVDLNKLFSTYDEDSDGSISNAEMKKLLLSGDLKPPTPPAGASGASASGGGVKGAGKAGGGSGSSGTTTYSIYDLNEDGKVTAAEVAEYTAEHSSAAKDNANSANVIDELK